MSCCNPCGARGLKFAGVVRHGNKYPHKVPTANVPHNGAIEPGVYVGCAFRCGDEADEADVCLGRCLVWATPNYHVAEVYIAEFEGDLYGQTLKIQSLTALTRDQMADGYDLFLTTIA